MPGVLNIAIDFIAWLTIHVGVSKSIDKIRLDAFNPDSWLYKERIWERNGRSYQTFLKIRIWKRLLPDGAVIFKRGFVKNYLANTDAAYLLSFILETCRAELIHWVIFFFCFFFFIWNDWWIGTIMIAYAFVVNIPCVVTQRFNRIRLRRIYLRFRNPSRSYPQ